MQFYTNYDIKFTSSSSCRSRCSCASSWRLCSSSICIRASSRPLCWRSILASVTISTSPPVLAGKVAQELLLLPRKRSYSACSALFSSSSSLQVKTKILVNYQGSFTSEFRRAIKVKSPFHTGYPLRKKELDILAALLLRLEFVIREFPFERALNQR